MDFKSVQAKSGTVPAGKYVDSSLVLTAHYPQLITLFTNSGDCYPLISYTHNGDDTP